MHTVGFIIRKKPTLNLIFYSSCINTLHLHRIGEFFSFVLQFFELLHWGIPFALQIIIIVCMVLGAHSKEPKRVAY